MKWLQHPWHVVFIHFPSALLPLDVLSLVWGKWEGDLRFIWMGFMITLVGVVMGWLAMLFGVWDLWQVVKKKDDFLIKKIMIHAVINGTVILLYSLLFAIDLKSYPALKIPSMLILLSKSILIALLILGNYLGGKLVFDHKIGIKK